MTVLNKINIAIIDYKMSNLFSIKNALNYLGYESKITSLAEDIRCADAIILPGVGAFAEAMANLKQLTLVDVIKEFIQSGKPCMGICLGLQLLFSKSYEFGEHEGLDIISGEVIKFPSAIGPVPSIGWNQIRAYRDWTATPLQGIRDKEFFYFIHSYFVKPMNVKNVLSLTEYGGINYCSSILQENVFAMQFHPEKSGKLGLELLDQWLKINK